TGASYPVRAGNLVRHLIDGDPAFRRIRGAVEDARHSVWLTVAFFAHDFRFPGEGDGLFDALDRAVERGVDVRILFWRPGAESAGYGRTFSGTPEDRDWLAGRGSRIRIRWDRAEGAFCHHQKSWLIDAGRPTETAFVGGINLTARALGAPGHRHGGQHDLSVELRGPSATDVHHNFVQRWNGASERASPSGIWPPEVRAADLAFPARASAPRGTSEVQIGRMIAPRLYADGTATPGGRPFDIAGGERSILEQYRNAIDAARSSIYIENQALPIPEIAGRLEAAARRGVDIVLLVPAEPEDHVRSARRDPAKSALFAGIEALARCGNVLLAGLAAGGGEEHRSVYVHAKAMLVDDAWATVGSCNLHRNSLSGHTEMNASVWDRDVVRALRRDLFLEHLHEDTGDLDDRAALRRFREVARANADRERSGDRTRQGLAFALDAEDYAR
ncbi:MAG: phosphatidylserine/phosphatidylglycerophosphate/cardiolipin synthase family protein, partial [Caulobacteraceae bacterium]|nr:phosphatidylserine/phosphatidylglycerophosphate/cardiolipin synthase family protein [Caulobacter sp.]